MPAHPDIVPRNPQSSRTAGTTGRAGEALELPILLRIPQITAASQNAAVAGEEREVAAAKPDAWMASEAAFAGTDDAFTATADRVYEASTAAYAPQAADCDRSDASYVDCAGPDYVEDAVSGGGKSWTERIGSKVVLLLGLLAIGGVGILATQSGPDIDDLPELPGDLYATVEDGSVAPLSVDAGQETSASPIEPAEDVYGQFDFSSVEGVEPVAVGETGQQAQGSQTAPARGSGKNTAVAARPQGNSGRSSAPRSAETPAVELAGPSTDDESDATRTESVPGELDTSAWPASEPIESIEPSVEGDPHDVASLQAPRDAYAPRGRTPAGRGNAVLEGGDTDAVLSEPVASEVEPVEDFAPLATANAGPVDWTQFDSHHPPSNRGAEAPSAGQHDELLAQEPATAGYGGGGQPAYRSAAVPPNQFAPDHQYRSAGFEQGRGGSVMPSPGNAYGLPAGGDDPSYSAAYGQQPFNDAQPQSRSDVAYPYPGQAGGAAGFGTGYGNPGPGQAGGMAPTGVYGSGTPQLNGAGVPSALQQPAAVGGGAPGAQGHGTAAHPGAQQPAGFANPYGAYPGYGSPSAYPPQR